MFLLDESDGEQLSRLSHVANGGRALEISLFQYSIGGCLQWNATGIGDDGAK